MKRAQEKGRAPTHRSKSPSESKTRSSLLGELSAECKRRFEATFGHTFTEELRAALTADAEILSLDVRAAALCERIYGLMDDLRKFEDEARAEGYTYFDVPLTVQCASAWAEAARPLLMRLPSRLHLKAPRTDRARVEFVRRAGRRRELRLDRRLTAIDLAPLSILCGNLPKAVNEFPFRPSEIIGDEQRCLRPLLKYLTSPATNRAR